jgi:ribosomal protein S18 acetylase RimI-like enzyme
MEIRKIDSIQANMLSRLSKAIYKEYYLHLWHPGGADWYQDEYAYHPDKLRMELDDSNNQHFVVYENDKPLGYLKIRINAVLQEYESMNSLEIERIYLHKEIAGKGIGRELMLLSEAIAKENNKQMIFLKAMDSSADAIAFYQKMGYTICGTWVLPFEQMKEEYRGMVILSKPI